MAERRLDRVVDAAARPADADDVARDVWLRAQIMKGNVDVARPLRLLFGLHGRRRLLEAIAGAVAKAPQIYRQHVHARGGQALGETVPDRPLAVALMQQQDSGS